MTGPDEYAILRRLDDESGLDLLAVHDDGIATLLYADDPDRLASMRSMWADLESAPVPKCRKRAPKPSVGLLPPMPIGTAPDDRRDQLDDLI